MGETEATDQRHTICVGSRRKGGSILQAKTYNVSDEGKAIFLRQLKKKKHSIGRTMSKPGERNRLNEDHGRKQSSSKLVLFSSFSNPPNVCAPWLGYTLRSRVTFHRGYHHPPNHRSHASVTIRRIQTVWGSGPCSALPHDSSPWRCLSFQVWRTAWTVIPSAARRRSGATTGEVTS